VDGPLIGNLKDFLDKKLNNLTTIVTQGMLSATVFNNLTLHMRLSILSGDMSIGMLAKLVQNNYVKLFQAGNKKRNTNSGPPAPDAGKQKYVNPLANEVKKGKKLLAKPSQSGQPVTPLKKGWLETMVSKLADQGYYVPIAEGCRGVILTSLEDTDYNNCMNKYECLNLVQLYKTRSVKAILNLCRGLNKHLIVPNYVDNVLYKYQKTFTSVIRISNLTGSRTKLPTVEAISRVVKDRKGNGHFFSPVYKTQNWTVYSVSYSTDIKERDVTYEGVLGDLTYLDFPGQNRVYFTNNEEYYVPDQLVDMLCVKMAYVKVTPGILTSIKYYARKYAADLGFNLCLKDLNLLTKIVLNKKSESGMLASVVYNERFSKYNELLEFKLSDSVLPMSEQDVCCMIDNLIQFTKPRETSGDVTTNVSVKKSKLSSLKCATFGDLVLTLKRSWKEILERKVTVEIPFGGGEEIKNFLSTAISYADKGKDALYLAGAGLVSKLQQWFRTSSEISEQEGAGEPEAGENF